MKKSLVAIISGENPSKMIEEALDLIGGKELFNGKILIKPNYVVAKHPSTGVTTDSRVIEGLIELMNNFKLENIVIGEGGAEDTERAFDVVGIREVSKRQKVKLVNLNRDKRIRVRISQSFALEEVEIAQTALDSTCIINIPTLKVHHMTMVTLCIKNLMGLILPHPVGRIMHNRIHEKLADLASLFKDKVKLNIVDGLVGVEGHEVQGNRVEMNLIIVGQDMVAVDSVATAVMGIDPRKVKYLRLAEERDLGVSNLKKIEVVGKKITEVERKFKLPHISNGYSITS